MTKSPVHVEFCGRDFAAIKDSHGCLCQAVLIEIGSHKLTPLLYVPIQRQATEFRGTEDE